MQPSILIEMETINNMLVEPWESSQSSEFFFMKKSTQWNNSREPQQNETKYSHENVYFQESVSIFI